MPDVLSKIDLLAKIQAIARAHGVEPVSRDADTLAGEAEAIGAKWFFGGRKVVYRMSCRLDESAHAAHVRESVQQSSWGIPPPTFTVVKTAQRGTRVSVSRTDRSVGGGGTLEYGRLREAMEIAVREAGWQFAFEAGRRP